MTRMMSFADICPNAIGLAERPFVPANPDGKPARPASLGLGIAGKNGLQPFAADLGAGLEEAEHGSGPPEVRINKASLEATQSISPIYCL